MPEQAVTFFAGKLKLEGSFFAAAAKRAYPAVVCHPHPQFGGTMDNNVVMAAVRALQQTGHCTLRFNFRGVGRSQGRSEGGAGEVEDVRAAIEFVREKTGADVPVVLVGYSFGAWVSAQAVKNDNSVAHLILIAPPTAMFDLSMLLDDPVERSRHFIAGDRDQYCDQEELQRIYKELAGPKSLRIVPHTDHFFFAHETQLMEAIKEAVADHSPE